MRRVIRFVSGLFLLALAIPAAAQPAPGLLSSTYYGGSSHDFGVKVAMGPGGSVWVAGHTGSPDLSKATNELDPLHASQDAFVSRWTADGALLFSTYAGTGFNDEACGLVVRADGTAFLAFAAYVWGTDGYAVYLARIGPAGELESVRSVATPPQSTCADLALDPRGRLWVGGSWTEEDGYLAGYLASVDPDLPGTSTIVFRRTLYHDIRALAFGPSGDLWITGSAPARTFEYSRPTDAFVARLSPDATVIRWSTRFGGRTGDDQGQSLVMDALGNAWVAGWTWAEDFPALHAVQPVFGGATDAFVTAVGPTGELIASTYLGGAGSDHGEGIALGPSGITLVGATDEDFPGAGGAPVCDPEPYCDNVFVTWLAPGDSELLRTVLLAGRANDQSSDVVLDARGVAAVTGWTGSPDFPTVDSLQPHLAGSWDAFFARLAPPSRPPDCSAATASPDLLWPPNGKLRAISILGVTDPDGDRVNLTITRITQDESLSKPGSPDATGVGTARPMVRADRAGGGDGRVYHLRFIAEDGKGGRCQGEVRVCAPHDARKRTCGDGGALVDSASSR